MRVKIAYTVKLEEVEKEVSEIMSRAASDLDFAYQELTRIQLDLNTKTGDINSKLEMINTIRLKLATADQVLEDCYLILEGLENTKSQLKESNNEIEDG